MLRITDIVRLLKGRGGLQSYDLTIAGSGAATAANYTVPLASTVNNQRSKVIVSVIVRYAVASTSGTLQIKKCGATVAAASGTDVLASTISLSATAETNYAGTLSTTAANLIIRPGDTLYCVAGGTLTNLSGIGIRVVTQQLAFSEIRDL